MSEEARKYLIKKGWHNCIILWGEKADMVTTATAMQSYADHCVEKEMKAANEIFNDGFEEMMYQKKKEWLAEYKDKLLQEFGKKGLINSIQIIKEVKV